VRHPAHRNLAAGVTGERFSTLYEAQDVLVRRACAIRCKPGPLVLATRGAGRITRPGRAWQVHYPADGGRLARVHPSEPELRQVGAASLAAGAAFPWRTVATGPLDVLQVPHHHCQARTSVRKLFHICP
jgi:hypothetical protein